MPLKASERDLSLMPPTIKTWFNQRGISDAVLEKRGLGWTGRAISIPVFARSGELAYRKYRRSPFTNGGQKYWYDKGAKPELYNWDVVRSGASPLLCLLFQSYQQSYLLFLRVRV
mgnify:CR=1 FL=1